MIEAVFAIPGDMHQRTGGFIYEATVLRCLNEIGCATDHLQLPASFPDPSPLEMQSTLADLRAVAADQVIILDGLVSGAIDPVGLTSVTAPIIAMVHHPLALETGLSDHRAAYLLSNERAVLAQVAHVVVPSPHTAEILTSSYNVPRDKITVALPGFDRPGRASDPVSPPLILSVGLLAERKGHDLLIAALALIRDLEWQAEIIGKPHDDRYTDALRLQLTELGLEGRVILRGELSASELQDQYRCATLFALATRYEGYGMVLSEAMLWGLPVVSCDVGAVPDTVGSAGLLVPPGDPPRFADAMRAVLTNEATRQDLSKASVEKAARLPCL